ncbi:hypothetical protein WICPIJ_006044 [Wickerhamomyces pijperi]|uniref:Uncharacterized protein n=1 Tax=Wickerhamomyces pijperi TaxID=599730 RepID=A0A9P8TLC5_WICPI|nr:hypothetical protein WICPIJ_006044 [Wickerhamomyces pijperi]
MKFITLSHGPSIVIEFLSSKSYLNPESLMNSSTLSTSVSIEGDDVPICVEVGWVSTLKEIIYSLRVQWLTYWRNGEVDNTMMCD